MHNQKLDVHKNVVTKEVNQISIVNNTVYIIAYGV